MHTAPKHNSGTREYSEENQIFCMFYGKKLYNTMSETIAIHVSPMTVRRKYSFICMVSEIAVLLPRHLKVIFTIYTLPKKKVCVMKYKNNKISTNFLFH